MISPKNKPDTSTPDLESLDASWGDDDAWTEDEEDAASLEDVDDGWETVPDPKGGPPIRRRVSPKERARRRRERQRAKADAARQKQKTKKLAKKSPRIENDTGADSGAKAENDRPVATKGPAAAAKKKSGISNGMIVLIAALLVFAAWALYFMMSSRP